MIDLNSIKLIIWDLDDTLWSGTLSEGGAILPKENARLVQDLTDCGIINSICSKNEFEPTKKHLQDLKIWDFFVFPSINWNSKGPQLKEKLDKMALRPVNVLFLDDNPSNLGEAKHFLPTIQIGGPDTIPDLIHQVALLEKKDLSHKRLNQYKILEEKDTASRTYSNNEEFLYDSHIQVEIHHDCTNQIQRIHELILRSNQLNYTKKRINLEDLSTLLQNPDYDCGYVTVKDRFGDYGLVGFYAKGQKRLEHFLFSCRTMGQKIEQWVYAQLGFPGLEVVGEVRTRLNTTDCPGWINQKEGTSFDDERAISANIPYRVLLKGPCDLSHSLVYIKNADCITTEFTYVSNEDGKIIDAYNHSVHIEGLHLYSDEDNAQLIQDCIFIDPSMLKGSFFNDKYDIIFLSTLIESTYQIYQKKGTNLKVVFGGLDLTNPANWNGYITGEFYNGKNVFTEDFLRRFSKEYECIGLTTPEMYISFLQHCLEWLPINTTLCLILGATKIYEGSEDVKLRHLNINEAIKSFSLDHPRIKYIEVDDCVHDYSDFEGGINHFSAKVYYEIALRIILNIRQITGQQVQSFSSNIVLFDKIILSIRYRLKRFIRPGSSLYSRLKVIYDFIYKKRNSN